MRNCYPLQGNNSSSNDSGDYHSVFVDVIVLTNYHIIGLR